MSTKTHRTITVGKIEEVISISKQEELPVLDIESGNELENELERIKSGYTQFPSIFEANKEYIKIILRLKNERNVLVKLE